MPLEFNLESMIKELETQIKNEKQKENAIQLLTSIMTSDHFDFDQHSRESIGIKTYFLRISRKIKSAQDIVDAFKNGEGSHIFVLNFIKNGKEETISLGIRFDKENSRFLLTPTGQRHEFETLEALLIANQLLQKEEKKEEKQPKEEKEVFADVEKPFTEQEVVYPKKRDSKAIEKFFPNAILLKKAEQLQKETFNNINAECDNFSGHLSDSPQKLSQKLQDLNINILETKEKIEPVVQENGKTEINSYEQKSEKSEKRVSFMLESLLDPSTFSEKERPTSAQIKEMEPLVSEYFGGNHVQVNPEEKNQAPLFESSSSDSDSEEETNISKNPEEKIALMLHTDVNRESEATIPEQKKESTDKGLFDIVHFSDDNEALQVFITFVLDYYKNYYDEKSVFTRNPFSKMKQMLEENLKEYPNPHNQVKTVGDIAKYVKSSADTRTAKLASDFSGKYPTLLDIRLEPNLVKFVVAYAKEFYSTPSFFRNKDSTMLKMLRGREIKDFNSVLTYGIEQKDNPKITRTEKVFVKFF